jgi:hypothetical protein
LLSEFKTVRGLIKQRTVEPFTVVENFDILKDGKSGFIPSFEMTLVNEFFFKRSPKTFKDGKESSTGGIIPLS